jgi:uncharacterized paraquat-inducible protein A
MVTITVATAALLICIGALLGAIWTRRLLQQRLHEQASQQAQERRMLAKEWAAIHRRRGECPRCTDPLSQPDRQLVSRAVPD